MSNSEEALKIWKALKPMVDRQIEEKTRSCIRAKKMVVTTAPDGSVIGVAEPYGEEILIPYSSALSGVEVGDAVWVWMYYSSSTNAIAMANGEGQISFDDPPPVSGTVSVVLSDTYLTSSWENSGGTIISGPSTGQGTLSFAVSGVPDGASIDSVVFSATFGNPYTGGTITVNSETVGTGSQTVSLTPTATGNGTYSVSISFHANGNAALSDGTHSSTVTVTSPTVTVSYTV